MPVEPVKLYLATSLDELFSKINAKKSYSTNTKMLLKSSLSLLEEAKCSQALGDEERAFLFFMRYCELIQTIRKGKNAPENQAKIKESLTFAISSAEILQISLTKRYEKLVEQEITAEISCLSLNTKPKEIEEESKTLLIERDTSIPKSNSITSIKLYELMNDRSITLLIMDVRSCAFYKESRMKYSNCISVPEDIIRPGITSMAIEKLLPSASLSKWKKRTLVDFVVLLDWSSSVDTLQEKSPIHALQEAICKWDQDNILKSDPLILERGYDDWLCRYPAETTNSNVTHIPRIDDISSFHSTILQDVEYPDLNEAFLSIPNDDDDTQIDEDTSLDSYEPSHALIAQPQIDRSKKPQLSNNIDNATSRIFNGASKIAWPDEDGQSVSKVLNQQEQLVDDDVKNTKELLEKEQEFQRFCQSKESEANVFMLEEVQKREEELLLKLEELERKKNEYEKTSKILANENSALKQQLGTQFSNRNLLSQKHLKRKMDEKMKLNAEVEKLRKERRLKETQKRSEENLEKPDLSETPKTIQQTPKKNLNEQIIRLKPEPINRGLSRSHSSPNINELFDDQENKNSVNLIPDIDRNVKPHRRPTVDRMLKPGETSAARQRDLNPVYSSHSNAQTGLKNLGNTCYMNAVIQCLHSTIPLTNYLVSKEYIADINKYNKEGTEGNIMEELSVVMHNMSNGRLRSIAPNDFKHTVSHYLPMCVGYEQQDAHEFLTCLMEKLHADVNVTANNGKKSPLPDLEKLPSLQATSLFWDWHTKYNDSKIVDLFEGVLQSKLTCLYCKTESNNYEVFSCLSVPIPSQTKCTLKDSIQSLLKAENISGEAAWDCPSCKQKREAEKKMVICKLPKILVVHLKRFYYKGQWKQKLQTLLDFPIQELDMQPYLNYKDPKSKYFAYGVVNHYGTMEGGHYTAFCKKTMSEKWFKFDDHDVNEMSVNSVKTSAAYILFYSSINF